jgi:hypothetical protein
MKTVKLVKKQRFALDEETATFVKVAAFLIEYTRKRRAAQLAEEPQREGQDHCSPKKQ